MVPPAAVAAITAAGVGKLLAKSGLMLLQSSKYDGSVIFCSNAE